MLRLSTEWDLGLHCLPLGGIPFLSTPGQPLAVSC